MNQEGPVRHVRAGPSALYVCSWVLSKTHVLAGTVARTCVENAVHCEDGCSALQERLQCTASFPANVCNRPCKRLQPPSQTFAVKRIFSSHVFLLTSSLLFAIRCQTMIISELHRIIGWFWVTQAKKCILCTMYVRKKHNRSGSTSVVVVSKASEKYREI